MQKYLPYMVEVRHYGDHPECLLHKDESGLITCRLAADIEQWMKEYMHEFWIWDANYVDVDARTDVYVRFFFRSLSDATYFRLAYSA